MQHHFLATDLVARLVQYRPLPTLGRKLQKVFFDPSGRPAEQYEWKQWPEPNAVLRDEDHAVRFEGLTPPHRISWALSLSGNMPGVKRASARAIDSLRGAKAIYFDWSGVRLRKS
jgi:hypothetical protein